MFSRILIANRGEIACRIIDTARRMGIATVAVYSDADRTARHVRLADEAVRLGPAPAAESYLAIGKIVAACRATGAQAVHPGYGFLSERAAFARALADAGIAFIGPNAAAIDLMGDKIAARQFAARAGVPTIPGSAGVVGDAAEAVRIARAIGLPVMIKAAAGGGGKGMRIARTPDEIPGLFAHARAEALAAFGDDRILLEKYIARPRHIEIQVLGDRHGHVIHLGERECSIQRRSQKVLEEAPSPLLDAAARLRLGAQAVALARAAGYDSAGTVEFICDQDQAFYFLEMNTRLQVEHAVTELVTGVDLVEQMIRVAAGETLGLAQADVRLDGWAVESRIYAEDPERGFLPAAGRLSTWRPPAAGCLPDGVTLRIDTGVFEGDVVTAHYDPMLAKLITHAATRQAAIGAQCEALDRYAIEGIAHNVPFLSALMHHPHWRAAQLSTDFIAQAYPRGYRTPAPDDALAARIAAVAAVVDECLNPGPDAACATRARVVRMGARAIALALGGARGRWQVRIGDDAACQVIESDWRTDEPIWQGRVGGQRIAVGVRADDTGLWLSHGGTQVCAMVLSPREFELLALMPRPQGAQGRKGLVCPTPARVVSVAVETGDLVAAGSQLCILESMKMEVSLEAEEEVLILQVEAKPGDMLNGGDIIMDFA